MTAPLQLDEDGLLTCRRCGARAPIDDFTKSSHGKLGVIAVCRKCTNAQARERRQADPARFLEYTQRSYRKNAEQKKRYAAGWRERNPEKVREQWRRKNLEKYGLTPAQYDEMLASQDGVCAICRQVDHVSRRLHVDHCHSTGRVRGLLCGPCNSVIGLAREDPAVLRAAIDYLGRMASN